MEKYTNVISLGWFCGISQELERIGLRSKSYPFDWLITESFVNVIRTIESGFRDFFEYDNLYQLDNPAHYIDIRSKFRFFHDFTEITPPPLTYDSVRLRYKRRISRLYQTIQTPTLFIRYCSCSAELEWVIEHYDVIVSFFKSYHSGNDIIFIHSIIDYNEMDLPSDSFFYVEKDNGDTVCRKCFEKNIHLRHFVIEHINIPTRERLVNLFRYTRKDIVKRLRLKLCGNKKLKCHYVHDKQYSEINTL